jgi:hypothetical protein
VPAAARIQLSSLNTGRELLDTGPAPNTFHAVLQVAAAAQRAGEQISELARLRVAEEQARARAGLLEGHLAEAQLLAEKRLLSSQQVRLGAAGGQGWLMNSQQAGKARGSRGGAGPGQCTSGTGVGKWPSFAHLVAAVRGKRPTPAQPLRPSLPSLARHAAGGPGARARRRGAARARSGRDGGRAIPGAPPRRGAGVRGPGAAQPSGVARGAAGCGAGEPRSGPVGRVVGVVWLEAAAGFACGGAGRGTRVGPGAAPLGVRAWAHAGNHSEEATCPFFSVHSFKSTQPSTQHPLASLILYSSSGARAAFGAG